jgi:DNA repair exonuclease SbcCD ATPase subunit
MANALHSFQELGRNQLVLPAGGTKPAQLATAHTPHTQLGQPQPQSLSVVRPAQPVGKLGQKERMLNELHEAIERAKETATEVLKQIEIALAELESTRKQVEEERGNLPSEQRVQLEASLQASARMEAEIGPRSEALDAKARELSQRESAVAGLEKEKAGCAYLKKCSNAAAKNWCR